MTTASDNANSAFNTINKNFSYLNNAKPNMASALNSALTPNNGECTWNISHTLNTTNILCSVYQTSSGNEIVKNLKVNSSNSLTITLKSSTAISAGSLKAIILGI